MGRRCALDTDTAVAVTVQRGLERPGHGRLDDEVADGYARASTMAVLRAWGPLGMETLA